MKKISLLALALSTTFGTAVVSQSPAAPCPCPKAFQGFSFGGTIGYGVGRATTSTTTTSSMDVTVGTAPNGVRINPSSNSLNAIKPGIAGADGGLLVGYLQRFGNFGLGVDFLANWASSSGSETRSGSARDGSRIAAPNSSDSSSVSVKVQNSLQVRGVFSYVISNLVMPKIMLGWDNSQYRFDLQESSEGVTNYSYNDGTDDHDVALTSNLPTSLTAKKKRLNGFLWGAGVDFLVAKNVVCGLEYTGVATASFSPTSTLGGTYSYVNTNVTNVTSVPGRGPIASSVASKFKAQYNTFKMTIKYIF